MKKATWGSGYAMGLSSGIYNAIHRITYLEAEYGSKLTSEIIKDYLKKDSEWEMREMEGFSYEAFMADAGDWQPGWWNADSFENYEKSAV